MFVREPRKVPVVLSLEEVARLLEAAPGPKYRAALGAAYGAGLRVSEVVALKVSDVDSKRIIRGSEPFENQMILNPLIGCLIVFKAWLLRHLPFNAEHRYHLATAGVRETFTKTDPTGTIWEFRSARFQTLWQTSCLLLTLAKADSFKSRPVDSALLCLTLHKRPEDRPTI